jgi:hypothetical protein
MKRIQITFLLLLIGIIACEEKEYKEDEVNSDRNGAFGTAY